MKKSSNNYGEVDADDDWSWNTIQDKHKKKQKEETFIPIPGTDIARYKTEVCIFLNKANHCFDNKRCKFAHNKEELREYGAPLPIWVKNLYEEDTEHNNEYSKNDYQNKEIKIVTNLIKSFYDTDSRANRPKENYRISKLTKLEREFTNLQLEKSEVKHKYKQVTETNAKLMNQMRNYDNFKELANTSSSKIEELEKENKKLKFQIKSVKSQSELEDILIKTVKELDDLTRSVLTDKLINEPSLTPSLEVVDKSEIYSILDKDPNHVFLVKAKLYKGMIYKPMHKMIMIRENLKQRMRSSDKVASEYLRDAKCEANDINNKREDRNFNLVYEKLTSKTEELSQEIKKLNDEKGSHIKKINELKETISCLEIKVKEHEIDAILGFKDYREIKTKNESNHKNECQLIEKIKNLFECPMSISEIITPIILPSGVTVDASVADKLIA